jgi:hypothetical protein
LIVNETTHTSVDSISDFDWQQAAGLLVLQHPYHDCIHERNHHSQGCIGEGSQDSKCLVNLVLYLLCHRDSCSHTDVRLLEYETVPLHFNKLEALDARGARLVFAGSTLLPLLVSPSAFAYVFARGTAVWSTSRASQNWHPQLLRRLFPLSLRVS